MRVGSGPTSRASIFRQDPTVSAPSVAEIPRDKIGKRLQGPRVAVVVGRRERRAYPDKNGDYLFPPSSPKFDQVQSFVSTQKTLDLFQDYADRKIDWAFESEDLAVIPHAGEGKNAYYARWNESISFYSFDSKPLGKRVHTSQSADVVSHETGHAILDGLKPEYGKTFDRETKAMHEAFGDCASMLLTISRPQNRADVLAETKGDLRQDNCISRVAEEFGTAVRAANRDPNDDKPFLRNANNTFTYVPPSTLPKDGPRDTLSAESHSFCQIFTRAFYGAIVESYEQLLASGLEPDQALTQAGHIMGGLLAHGVTMAAPNRARFKDVALAMLRADELAGSGQKQALTKAFTESEILRPGEVSELERPLPQGTPQEILEELGLTRYEEYRAVTDDNGLTTKEYLLREERPVNGLKAWGNVGMTVDVTGGLSLTFDTEGALVHLAHLKPDLNSELKGIPEPQSLLGLGVPSARLLVRGSGHKIERLPIWTD